MPAHNKHACSQACLLNQERSHINLQASTQLIEKWWDLLKHHAIPEEAGLRPKLLNQYALALLWTCYADGDPLEDLGLAVQRFMKVHNYDKKKMMAKQEEAEFDDDAASGEEAIGDEPLPCEDIMADAPLPCEDGPGHVSKDADSVP